MVRFQFKKGLRFLEGNQVWTLMRRTATGKLQFESDDDGMKKVLTEQEIYQRWANRQWLVDETSLSYGHNLMYLATPRDLRSLAEVDQLKVKRKLAYLQALEGAFAQERREVTCCVPRLNEIIARSAIELADPNPPNWVTLWRWWQSYKGTKCFSKIQDKRRRSGRNTNPTLFSIFEEVILEVFLTPQRRPGKVVVDAMRDRVARINQSVSQEQHLKAPAPATVYRWLEGTYRSVVEQARLGKAHTLRELRTVTGQVRVKRLLERVEIDHTPIDLWVVCHITRMALGRPWLTLVIDRMSRMVMGFYISFHAPSAYSVMYALRMAILPKDALLGGIPDIQNPWPAHGLPTIVAMDNGPELHALALEAFARDGRFGLHYCGVAQPELKGGIERALGTLSHDLFHQMPGTVFHCIEARGDYPSESKAAIDINQLTRILIKWIVDVYHCTPHRGLMGLTPLKVWQAEEANAVFELPAYPHQLDLMVGQIAARTVFHYGVEYDGIKYNTPALGSLAERIKKKQVVQIRVYEHDVSYVDVLMPKTGEFVRIPAIDLEYCQGLNRHTHRLIRKQVRARFEDAATQQQLREAKAAIQQMIADALRDHKTGKRKMAAAAKLHDSEAAVGLRAGQALANALEPTCLETPVELPVLSSAVLLPTFNVSQHEWRPA
jgi:putative transposase